MSGMQIRAFRPLGPNNTINIATTAASQTLNLVGTFGTGAIRLVNSGTDITFVNFSRATATTTTAMPLLPNTAEVFTLSNDITGITVIGAAGGNTLYVTFGEGL